MSLGVVHLLSCASALRTAARQEVKDAIVLARGGDRYHALAKHSLVQAKRYGDSLRIIRLQLDAMLKEAAL